MLMWTLFVVLSRMCMWEGEKRRNGVGRGREGEKSLSVIGSYKLNAFYFYWLMLGEVFLFILFFCKCFFFSFLCHRFSQVFLCLILLISVFSLCYFFFIFFYVPCSCVSVHPSPPGPTPQVQLPLLPHLGEWYLYQQSLSLGNYKQIWWAGT